MIEKIIKSNGVVQEFDAGKLNRWMEWAANELNISWSTILFKAIRQCHPTTTSAELQQALINACVENDDLQHLKMAARLQLGVIYKQAIGGFKDHHDFPSLYDFVSSMVHKGFYREMDYTKEELDWLGKHIDHNVDFTYQYSTVKQLADKYLIKTNVIQETPQFLFMSIALSNSENEDRASRLESVLDSYRKMSSLTLNLPTPTVALERTTQLQAPSCCVISSNDTVDSIGAATHVAYKMTAASSGIGIELNTRAPKEPVKGGKIEHGGKRPYYKLISEAVKANKQVVRGGSATVTFHNLDPEIIELLTLKQIRTDPTYRIDELDYSFAVNNLFLRKVAKNERWMVISSLFANDLWEASYSGDESKFESLYESYLNHPKAKLIDSRAVFAQWVKARADNGRVYITFLDNMNQHTPFKDPIRLSNLCVAPETEILTDNGYIPIVELEDKTVNVWNGFEWSEVIVRKTGENQPLIKVVMSDGSYIECTPYHKFYLKSGYDILEKRACDLDIGDMLIDYTSPKGYKITNMIVVNVINDKRVDNTYCVNEPKRHMVVFNGILTGQCQEIALPTKGFDNVSDLFDPTADKQGEVALCSLGSIVVSRIESDDEYESSAYTLAKMIDNGFNTSTYPFPQVEKTAKARRSIGVGMTDLATLLAKNGLKYDTYEGRTFLHRLAERHYYYLLKASVRLAKERGKCEWFYKTKFAEGWLPVDSYSRKVDEYCDPTLQYDWESLRKEVKRHGVRFSVLVAYMPVESSSLLTNSTNGLYPIRKRVIQKKSQKGLVKFAVDNELDYQFAGDIDHLDLVKLYSIFQKFCDQGISADFYTKLDGDSKLSMKSMLERVLTAAKSGMKTFYYENYLTDDSDTPEEASDPSCESCKL